MCSHLFYTVINTLMFMNPRLFQPRSINQLSYNYISRDKFNKHKIYSVPKDKVKCFTLLN